MKETLATRHRFLSDDAQSDINLQHFAKGVLGELVHGMELSGVDQAQRTFELESGETITVSHRFGESEIRIDTPDIQPYVTEIKYRLYQRGRVYVEIKDPDFDKWKDSSQSLYWLFDKEVFEELASCVFIEVMKGAPTGIQRSQALNNAIIEQIGALEGDNIVLLPFSFKEIEPYCPIHPIFGFPTTSMVKGMYTEAKSFETVDNEYDPDSGDVKKQIDGSARYVGYCTGSLINSTQGIPLYQYGSPYRSYQQFHIINDILIWFAELPKVSENGFYYRDLACRTHKIENDGSLTLLGSFLHWDYKGVFDSGGPHRVKRTEDPGWGNILTCVSPPSGVSGIYDVTDEWITLHIPYLRDGEEGFGENPPYGDDGGHMKVTYAHDGLATHSGYERIWNETGALATEFTGFIWGNERESVKGGFNLTTKYKPSPYHANPEESSFSVHLTATVDFLRGSSFFSEAAMVQNYQSDDRTSSEWWLENYTVMGRGLTYESDSDGAPALLAGSQCIGLTGNSGYSYLIHEREFFYPTAYVAVSNTTTWVPQWMYREDTLQRDWTAHLICIEGTEHLISSETYPKPDGWGPNNHVGDWGTVAASRLRYFENWNPSNCCRCGLVHHYFKGYYAFIVGRSVIGGVVPSTPVVHRISMSGCDDAVCMRTHMYYDYDGMTWDDKLALLKSSIYTAWHAKYSDVDSHGWDNDKILIEKQGFVSKGKIKQEVNVSKVIVYFDETTIWTSDNCLCRRGVGLAARGWYEPYYAFMDDRACGRGVFCFVGTSKEYKDGEDNVINNRSLDKWDILSYHDKSLKNVTSEFFNLLELDINDTSQIVSMGMV